MKTLLLIAMVWISTGLLAQPFTESIKEADVPAVVKETFENNVGFPVDEWRKLTISGAPRFVAVFQMLDPASGKTLQNRYRYNNNGRLTSYSQYRGSGIDQAKDFYLDFLAEASDAFRKRIQKLLQDNTLLAFEGFSFVPGNQTDFIHTHRFVLKDKKGKRTVIYFSKDGTEVDMTNYPLRKTEAEELDL
ncbi:MAG: hypothetical protein KF856_02185 [Cyclobacteriaceae bacterium]|nr:hypothetical protein [Cyclobacteriaceae bacterium]